MPREIITINVGQCGNQIGNAFFKRICTEHGIESDGSLKQTQPINDRKDVFFYQADDQRYVPRSINIDLEPRALDSLRAGEWKNFYNPGNFILPSIDGAGNRWTDGYFTTAKMDEILDVIDREVEHCDTLEGFFFCHSICGGTGSGLGSRLMEKISDRYPKQMITAFSVTQETSDVVVSPINSILTMKRLITECQSCVMFDNSALTSIAGTQFGLDTVMIDDLNSIISASMAALTSLLRFPTTLYSSLNNLMSHLCPSRFAHFLTTSYTPLRAIETVSTKTSAIDIMKRLIQPQNLMTKISNKQGKYASLIHFLQGEVSYEEMNEALQRFNDRKLIDYVPWNKDALKVMKIRQSPLIQRGNRLSGMMLANNTGIRHSFHNIHENFALLRKKNAFLGPFREAFHENDQEFIESSEIVKSVIDEYEQMEKNEYLDYDFPIYEHLSGLAKSKLNE